MFKIYQQLIIKSFLNKLIKISLIFLSLIFILSLLEEINFFKDINNVSFILPYLLTLLNAPITLFEIFPFIFIITTQFFFYDLFKDEELNLLKKNGIRNTTIVQNVFFLSLIIGVFNVIIYYNASSKLKFIYSDIKNNYSNDNKYLAMVTDSGLWIKDEINGKKYIIKSKYIKDDTLFDNVINEFDIEYQLLRIIRSKKINIETNEWIIENPSITFQNKTDNSKKNINFSSNFDSDRINNYFSNISSLNMFELYKLKKDYDELGYSTDEIKIQLLKLLTTPIFYGIFSVFAITIMFNFTKKKSFLFHIITGIFLSVIIYYINFIFNSLGSNGKIPIYPSIFFPLFIIIIFTIIGLININEK